ncbi:winged helix-turn-helix transcriptional regulator [Chitinophaga filiformis]|uniref:DNA-binding transcriptional regulator, HxlR family n=1 Tax=Chitinophaga filiformis TaxID=104663 RepID=A0A1G7LR43_CHIFI|nr:helix-turn-helix domain-containing protein [Chitinophaga filiformis]SDF51449.1 DNA-binding transcriptional regulator, HxlR family [Chitinophaga filiformis]
MPGYFREVVPCREVLSPKGSSYLCAMGTSRLTEETLSKACIQHFKAIEDTQYILSGKWRVLIISMLAFRTMRYLELQRFLSGIGTKMLSKELQHLEINGLVNRTVRNTKPVTVEYELTSYGKSLKPLLDEMARWGQEHKKRIVKEVSGK